ncbi:hypothetical protein ACH437_30555 [Streptomyces xinghaiensis]|uniref:hypothetical protein n=1 Tax=Streptomyces xinghaiensis TaxID=1038928 RepID=UPI0037B3DABB
MRYFLSDDGGWMTLSGDGDLFSAVPEGFREVTEAEFRAVAGTAVLEIPGGGEGG